VTVAELSDAGISGSSAPIQLGVAVADAAVVDPSVTLDAGGPTSAATATNADDGCGCEATGAPSGGGALLAPMAGALVWLGRRRRRRRNAGTLSAR
jgi:MYXO-CTERM domain-containing protein